MSLLTVLCAFVALIALLAGRIRLATVAAVLLATAALAQGATPPDGGEVELALKLASRAIETRQYVLLAPAAVILLVMGLRVYGAQKWPALKSDRNSALLTIGLSFVVTVGTSLLSGHTLGLGLILSPLMAALSAGAYVLTKKTAKPSDTPPDNVLPFKPTPLVEIVNGKGPQP